MLTWWNAALVAGVCGVALPRGTLPRPPPRVAAARMMTAELAIDRSAAAEVPSDAVEDWAYWLLKARYRQRASVAFLSCAAAAATAVVSHAKSLLDHGLHEW